ncbi:DNA glycosylase AlkZ-like family protein [Nocardioides deserti]|uniref:Winged helix DNA-binding domain-containing protein n=1 Tax=Nocardioides deserti TaxID=1588644 RepID=A0ABR6U387_9ACTN|nr:crosslink repair DNA glycosylase YcaQ family protein [Nocardioides deserti]MBC2958857.1 winged helix DNA-binding domain-containing protein [Nocardioides deserti]GGO69448.1 hypothetical protein GCM10012276_05660 [Nocardioides deserti]
MTTSDATASPDLTVTRSQALGWRLERHGLDPVGAEPVPEVVRRLGAVLGIDDTLAELAVRTRSAVSRPGDLQQALADGTVVKAFAFRGAVHYLSPEDGGAYLALRAAGRQWELPSWVEHYGLRPADWPDFRAAVREALTGGPLTILELGEVLTTQRAYRHLRQVFAEGAHTLVKPLSWQGDLSLGAQREGRLTLQSLAGNPRWQGIPDLDEAGPAAVRAYLRTYGPATHDHVHYWLGEGLSAGRKRLAGWLGGLRDELATVDVAGTTAYVLAEDADSLAAAQPSDAVRLLPGHDQWVMGPGTKDTSVTPLGVREAVTRKAGLVVVGGVVRGTWTRKDPEVDVAWFDGGPTPPERALEQEAVRLGSLLGRDLHWSRA